MAWWLATSSRSWPGCRPGASAGPREVHRCGGLAEARRSSCWDCRRLRGTRDGSPGWPSARSGRTSRGDAQAVCATRHRPPPRRRGCGTGAGSDRDGHALGSRGSSWGCPREARRPTCEHIPFLPPRFVFSCEPCQLLRFGPPRLARAALGFDLWRLGPPAIPHRVRTPKFSRHLGHRTTRFPCEPDCVGLECVGKLTSRDCWQADLQFHHAPPYGDVCESEGGAHPDENIGAAVKKAGFNCASDNYSDRLLG